MLKFKRNNTKNAIITEPTTAIDFSAVEDLSLIKVEELSDVEKENYFKELKNRGDRVDRIGEVEQKVSKNSQKKKKIINIIFFFVNLGVVAGLLAYQLTQEAFVPLSGLGISVGFVFLLAFFFFTVNVIDTFSMGYLIKKDTKKLQLGFAFKSMMVGRYYDSITPLSIGGEPAQVAYLKTHGVSAAASLSIPVAKMIFQQLVFFIVSIIALIVSAIDSSFGSFASITSIIGFVVSFGYLGFIIFLCVSKNFGKKIVARLLKFLQKIKILKNYEKQYQKVMKIVEDFQMVMKQYMKSFKDFSIMFCLFLFRALFWYGMPFIIYSCFFPDGTFELFFRFFVCGVLIDLASSFFPLPGGTGMNELTFSALFGSFFAGGKLFWALIFWRMVTYYLFIIIGFFVVSYDISYGNRKYKWIKVRDSLRSESINFKQEQIKKFRKDRESRRRKEGKLK